jgi:agmatinase
MITGIPVHEALKMSFKPLVFISSLFLTTSAFAQYLGHEYEGEIAPIREGEAPVIPLDRNDPSYNVWQQLRDTSGDPAREPGIINLKQYDFGFSYNVIPTFLSTAVALTPADLKASNVEVAILGAVPDMGTGMRGAAHGPNAVRNSQVYGGRHHEHGAKRSRHPVFRAQCRRGQDRLR